ncbi:MAG: superfamily protein [Pedosphaera sp.]|nr:superfamily protein [Pedosphaera sp.]
MKTISRIRCLCLSVVLACFSLPAFGEALHYLNDEIITTSEFKTALGKPPADTEKDKIKADEDAVKKVQLETPAESPERKHAEAEERLTVTTFNGVLGPWAKFENFPATSNILQQAFDDTWTLTHKIKDIHPRWRPDHSKKNSYPSAHSAEAEVLAEILIMFDQTHKSEIEKRAEAIRTHRMILNKHYPSDLQAGRRIGDYVVQQMTNNPAFKKDFTNALQELRPHLDGARVTRSSTVR